MFEPEDESLYGFGSFEQVFIVENKENRLLPTEKEREEERESFKSSLKKYRVLLLEDPSSLLPSYSAVLKNDSISLGSGRLHPASSGLLWESDSSPLRYSLPLEDLVEIKPKSVPFEPPLLLLTLKGDLFIQFSFPSAQETDVYAIASSLKKPTTKGANSTSSLTSRATVSATTPSSTNTSTTTTSSTNTSTATVTPSATVITTTATAGTTSTTATTFPAVVGVKKPSSPGQVRSAATNNNPKTSLFQIAATPTTPTTATTTPTVATTKVPPPTAIPTTTPTPVNVFPSTEEFLDLTSLRKQRKGPLTRKFFRAQGHDACASKPAASEENESTEAASIRREYAAQLQAAEQALNREISEAQGRFAQKKLKLDESLAAQLKSLEQRKPAVTFEPPSECQLCYSDVESMEIKPCGHKLCSECGTKLQEFSKCCPWDRAPFDSLQPLQ